MSKYDKVKHLTKEEIIKNGSIFTSDAITKIVFNMLKPYLKEEDSILDFGAGYGAFIKRFNCLNNRIIATDIDSVSCDFLKKEFPNIAVYLENSLINVNRKKYKLNAKDRLIIIGNPPYNDTTSYHHKNQKGVFKIDKELKHRDLGISFLKMFAKLKPNYICILHPLSYLIKKNNFNSLKGFKDNYKLIDGIIFSSKEFISLKRNKSEFPVLCALYEKNKKGMNYDDILDFNFKIKDSNQCFKLNKILTIDGIINKVPKKDKNINSLQFYTLRDINALKRNATFIMRNIPNGIEVRTETLADYIWIDLFKEHFYPPKLAYIYGNLSPFYTKKLKDKEFRNKLVSYYYENKEYIPKYFSKEELEKVYGTLTENVDINELKENIENLYLF